MKTVLGNLISGFIPTTPPLTRKGSVPPLVLQVEQARHEWLSAQNYYNNVSDADLVDYASYLMQAAEKKYTYLLKLARMEGVVYSPFH